MIELQFKHDKHFNKTYVPSNSLNNHMYIYLIFYIFLLKMYVTGCIHL